MGRLGELIVTIGMGRHHTVPPTASMIFWWSHSEMATPSRSADSVRQWL